MTGGCALLYNIHCMLLYYFDRRFLVRNLNLHKSFMEKLFLTEAKPVKTRDLVTGRCVALSMVPSTKTEVPRLFHFLFQFLKLRYLLEIFLVALTNPSVIKKVNELRLELLILGL